MARLFVQYMAIYNNDNLSDSNTPTMTSEIKLQLLKLIRRINLKKIPLSAATSVTRLGDLLYFG